jgi:hypothetical protein
MKTTSGNMKSRPEDNENEQIGWKDGVIGMGMLLLYKDCRGCKGGIHHSIQTKNFNPNGLNPCRSGHSVGMKMENVRI